MAFGSTWKSDSKIYMKKQKTYIIQNDSEEDQSSSNLTVRYQNYSN